MKNQGLFVASARWVIFAIVLLVCVSVYFLFRPSVQKPINDAAHLNSPYVILISIDGYRYDYTDLYQPKHIGQFRQEGATAEGLIPVFPSSTFPNHYAIATGLYTENHGLLSNNFYHPERQEEYRLRDRSAVEDGSWYLGTPLWLAAVQQGMVSATFFWVGSEANIQGKRPSYYYKYDGTISNRQRIEQVVEWLKLPQKHRPHLITVYFSLVDSAGHSYGPVSDPVKEAVLEIDKELGHLFSEVAQLDLDVNYIIVSDHGMEDVVQDKMVALDAMTNLDNFKVFGSGPVVFLYNENTSHVDKAYEDLKKAEKHYKVYRRQEIPEKFRLKNHAATPHLVVVAEPPYSVGTQDALDRLPKGMHGYDPQHKKMWGIFYAKGPQIQPQRTIAAFENIHIYPFVMNLLGLKVENKIDGDPTVLKPLIKQ